MLALCEEVSVSNLKLFVGHFKVADVNQSIFFVCISQGKEAGIRTLVALDDQGGK